MWKLGDEEGTFDYSASSQEILFSSTPNVDQFIDYLNTYYVGTNKNIEFTELQIETYKLPFIQKHYRVPSNGPDLPGIPSPDAIK